MAELTTRTAITQALVSAANGDHRAQSDALRAFITISDAEIAVITGTGAEAIVDALTAGSATAALNAAAINSILTALRTKGLIAE